MSTGYNKVMLLGNLGADPELRVTQAGKALLTMRLATTESWFDKGANERKERTDWHSVCVWGARADALAKFLRKGSRVFVEGKIQTSSYDDRDGNKRYRTEIVATDILMAGSTGARGDADSGHHDQREPDPPSDRPARQAQPAQRPQAAPSGGGARPKARTPAPMSDDNGREDTDTGGGYGGGSDDDLPF